MTNFRKFLIQILVGLALAAAIIAVAEVFGTEPPMPICGHKIAMSNYQDCLAASCTGCAGQAYIDCSEWCAWAHQ